MLEAIFMKQPVAPVRINDQVPAELERIIYKALEKDCNLRYNSAAEIRTDLQRLRRDTSAAAHASSPASEPAIRQAAPVKKVRLWIAIAAGILILPLPYFLFNHEQIA
jgi:hypothetical protein